MRSGFYARKLTNRRARRPYKKTLTKKVAVLSKKVGNKERKFLDTQLNNIALTTAPIVTELTNVAQGNSDATRLGSKITIVGIELNYLVQSAISNSMRILIVQNRQSNGATINSAELYQDNSAGDNIVSPWHKDFKRKFTVKYDKVHLFSSTGNAFSTAKKYIKCNIPIRYDGNVGDITDVQSNSLSYVTSVDIADATAVNTVFVRLWFTDS